MTPLMTSTITTILLLITTIILVPTKSQTPTKWPDQFHSLIVMNKSGFIQVVDLWYDWTNGRNLNILQYQLGGILYDLEWNNGTSFKYKVGGSDKTCSTSQLEIGILRPNWLDGGEYVGQKEVDGFLCNVWTKEEFITYYEDVVTKRPVYWMFFSGREEHVMTFEVGAALEDANLQVPWYCFEEPNNATTTSPDVNEAITQSSLVDFGARKVQDM